MVGTAFGAGDGSTTFNVPDLRGRFPLGKDDLGGSSADRVTAPEADIIGDGSGAESHTLTIPEMPSHTHTLPIDAPGAPVPGIEPVTTSTSGVPLVTLPEGGGGAHNNMSPYQTVGYIIKT